MAMFGKALGNGYAITAIVGRESVMEAAQTTFISSTFWTERIGPTAALKVLEVMEREKSWKYITEIGAKIKKSWQKIADQNDLKITLGGLPALANFNFQSNKALEYKTLVSQEMLKSGYLASNSFYASTAHNEEIIDGYLDQLNNVFRLVAECESGRKVESLLKGPVCHGGFKRLN